MPNYRQSNNASQEFRELTDIIKKNDLQGRTLAINSFDVLMYTDKPVIWPYLKLTNYPVGLLKNQNPQKFLSELKKYNTNYILIWTKFIGGDTFLRNYPLYFYQNCKELILQKRISIVKITESKSFILLKVL